MFLLGACLPLRSTEVKARAGGLDLTFPAPENFEDVGEKFRTMLFELLVPSANRLVAAFAPGTEIAKLNAGRASGGLDTYAMVEAPRQAEYADCTPEAFQQMLKGLGAPVVELVREQAMEEFSARLKSLGEKSPDVGVPENVGPIFKKTDVYGSATLMKYSQGERSLTMVAASALIRVRQRVLYAYIFRRYESSETVVSTGKSLEVWADSILAKNK